MKRIFGLISFVLIIIFIVGCAPVEKKCSADTDCVKKTCCHAKDAVNKKYGPNCANRLCTMGCEAGTIDCGQGKIQCVSGACQAVMK